jgi:beta-lactam-binding protein with PASTA domain
VADFNRDGRPDLAFGVSGSSFVDVFLNWTGLAAPPCIVLEVGSRRLRTAKHYVRAAGCRLGRVRRRYSRSVSKNHVISQRPNSGAVLPSRSRVDVVISRGRRR